MCDPAEAHYLPKLERVIENDNICSLEAKFSFIPQSTMYVKLNRKSTTAEIMQRCSSMEDLSLSLPYSRKFDSDPAYILWKKSFENPDRVSNITKQNYWSRIKRGIHDMSSALSGQKTPKGFPSYTNLKLFQRTMRRTNNPIHVPSKKSSFRANSDFPIRFCGCRYPSPFCSNRRKDFLQEAKFKIPTKKRRPRYRPYIRNQKGYFRNFQ